MPAACAADHAKLGIDTVVQTIPPEGISQVGTDEAADQAIVDALRGVGLLVHEPDGS